LHFSFQIGVSDTYQGCLVRDATAGTLAVRARKDKRFLPPKVEDESFAAKERGKSFSLDHITQLHSHGAAMRGAAAISSQLQS
jgi:hypothetical protein